MAERLTRNNKVNFYFHDEASNMVYYKLQGLEDILEKYGIESVELLEHIIKKGIVINSTIEDFAKEEYDKMKQDRDTWQKACELMGKTIQNVYPEPFYRFIEDIPNYFYQQAKTEGNNE